MKRKSSVLLFSMLICLCATSLMAQTPFERMDRNAEGKLSRSEFRGPPSAFSRMDRDNDGYITRQEAKGTRLSGGVEQTRQVESRAPVRESTELIYVDTHNHLVGRRTMGRYNLEKPAQIALEAMNTTGVKLNLLIPMPQAVNQRLRLYLEDLMPLRINLEMQSISAGRGFLDR